ncbi:MAG: S8 family serine peptidase [Tahibacter sp.]
MLNRNRLTAAISLLLIAGTISAQSLNAVAPQAPTPGDLTDVRLADRQLLLLRAGLIDPRTERVDFSATGAASDVQSSHYALVQFNEGDRAARARLEKTGMRVLGYVPNNAYIVALGDGGLQQLTSDDRVRWAGYYQPGMKLDPALWTGTINALRAAPQGGFEIDVFGFSGESAERLAQALRKVDGLQITAINERADNPQVRVHVEASGLADLVRVATAEDGVSWVVPYYQAYVGNAGAIAAIQGNSTAGTAGNGAAGTPTPLWDHGLFGTGQIISISDSGLDANEAWFTTLNKGLGDHVEVTLADTPVLPNVGIPHPDNKVYGYWVQPGATAYDNNAVCSTSGTSFHGTHTSGTIAGDASGVWGANTYLASTPTTSGHDAFATNSADGMAPNAQLLFQDIGNDTSGCLSISDLVGTLRQAKSAGARIHSASWGGSDAGAYAGDDYNVDYLLHDQEDMVFVVAAGNDGPTATSIGSPGNAKNAITVGALGHAGSTSIASFSSRGPTADGRLKPDVMAPGSSTISASGDASTTTTPETPVSKSLSGTSMATPTVAGNLGLLQQFFRDGFYPRGAKTAADQYNPSGMATKAVLLNGTNPIAASSWFTNNFGWGRAWLDSNLWFSTTLTGGDDNRRLRIFERTNAAGLKTGQQHQYTIANVAAGQELRATLAWYDGEAQPGAAITLVNNLDLEVDGPGGTYKGNVFSTGVSATGGTADVRNTVEQVRFTAPTAGSYTFRVKGTNVPGGARPNQDTQGYALAVSGAFGLPNPAAFPAPTALAASNAGGNINVGFSAAGGAQGFQLYRANGTCAAAAAGDFRMVATGAASPLIDTTSQGGYTYAYKVRGVSSDVEGDVSGCVDIASSAACTLQPVFNTASTNVTSTQSSSCKVSLAWAPATLNCPTAALTYDVRRDSVPYMTAATTIAAGLTGSTYNDTAVGTNSTYYYRVVAQDSLGHVAPLSRVVNATPTGTAGVDGNSYKDDAGDTHAYMSTDPAWQITNTAAAAGSYSYHNTGDGGLYFGNQCIALTTPSIKVQAGAILSFKAKYDVEFQWDGMVMEISTDGGTTWNDLAPDGGYPTTLAQTGTPAINACGYAASHGAFSGVSTAASNADPNNGTAVAVFKPFTRTLASVVGQTVKIRWRFSSDGGAEFSGAFIDEVSLGGDSLFKDSFDTDTSGFSCTNP